MKNESQHVRIGVAVLIRKGKQILLIRRSHVHGAGSWSTPGGHLEFGETLQACAVREVKEETDLDIHNPIFLGITNDFFPEVNKHYITIWMSADYEGGEAVLNAPDEIDAISWFAWNEFPQPLFLSLEHLLTGQSFPPYTLKALINYSA